jgi:hypothetical protein
VSVSDPTESELAGILIVVLPLVKVIAADV